MGQGGLRSAGLDSAAVSFLPRGGCADDLHQHRMSGCGQHILERHLPAGRMHSCIRAFVHDQGEGVVPGAVSDAEPARSLEGGFVSCHAEVDGVRLHDEAGGDGGPLLLLGGWPQTRWRFHKVMPSLTSTSVSSPSTCAVWAARTNPPTGSTRRPWPRPLVRRADTAAVFQRRRLPRGSVDYALGVGTATSDSSGTGPASAAACAVAVPEGPLSPAPGFAVAPCPRSIMPSATPTMMMTPPVA